MTRQDPLEHRVALFGGLELAHGIREDECVRRVLKHLMTHEVQNRIRHDGDSGGRRPPLNRLVLRGRRRLEDVLRESADAIAQGIVRLPVGRRGRLGELRGPRDAPLEHREERGGIGVGRRLRVDRQTHRLEGRERVHCPLDGGVELVINVRVDPEGACADLGVDRHVHAGQRRDETVELTNILVSFQGTPPWVAHTIQTILSMVFLQINRNQLDTHNHFRKNTQAKTSRVRGVARLTRLPVTEKTEGSNPFAPAT